MDLIINCFGDLKKKINHLKINNYFEIGKEDRIAVFDLDNTLLIGDIGDAVFSMLKVMGYDLNLSWKDYLNILNNEGKELAYSKVVSAMAGLSINTIKEATERVLNSSREYLDIEDIKVPIPKAHPVMSQFVELLRENNFKIYVISATNMFSVRFACNFLFKIPEENCFGIIPETIEKGANNGVSKEILTGRTEEPLTISTGKETIYWETISKMRPIITAGDSETDIYLLNLVNSKGFSIWVGDDKSRYYKIKEQSILKNQFYFFER